MKTENIDKDTQLLTLAVHAGMLRHACEKALELLQNPDADYFDANKVERLLETALGETK